MKILLAFLFSLPLVAQYTPPSGGGGGGSPAGSAVTDAQCWGSVSTFGVCISPIFAGTVTSAGFSTGGTPPALTPGTGGPIALGEGTAPSVGAASGVDVCYADSTAHAMKCSWNNGSYLQVVQGPSSATSGHVATFNGTNGGLLQDGGALPTVTGGTCTNQVATAISGSAVPTCTTVTSAYVDSSVAPTASPTFTGTVTNNGSYAGSAKIPVANGGAVAQGSNICGVSDLCVTGNFTSAQIVSLTSTGSSWLAVIAAPAAGSFIHVDEMIIEGSYNGTAYGAGSNMFLYYGTGGGNFATATACATGNFTSAGARLCASGPVALGATSTANNATAVNLGISGTSYTCASTCGPVYYWVRYHIVSGVQ